MALPRWIARSNRPFVNPGAIKRGTWPVLVHVGRKTGRTHRTPIGAEPIDGGFLIFINYGPETDWVQNVVAAGSATLEIDGEELELSNPRVTPKEEAYRLLSSDIKKPPAWVGVSHCLVIDAVPTPTRTSPG